MMRSLLPLAAALLAALLPHPAGAQDKKGDKKKEEPRVLLCLPLGVKAGAATKVTVRGLKLDGATEVRFSGAKATAKLVSKGKAPPPDKLPPQKVGDTQAVVEFTVPAGAEGPTLPFTVVTPAGETKAHELLLDAAAPAAEKEPNEGFKQATAVKLPFVIEGAVGRQRDVDVFAFEVKKGQTVVFELQAGRHGSPLDGILTLYGPRGDLLLVADAAEGKGDPRLKAGALTLDGTYYISVIDAHDTGGALHAYRLVGRLAK
jgi:hypothetical protein